MEDLVCGFGLIGWNFVPSLKDTTEAEIAMLTHLATYVGGIDGDIGVACCCEFLGLVVRDIEGYVLATDPIADPVSVSVDEGDFDATVQDVGEIFEIATSDVGTRPVSYGVKGFVDTVG